MAATVPVPTLSTAGWVNSIAEKADYLLAHWYESNKSQSLIYGSEVSNLQYLIEENGNNPISAMRAMRSELETYLRRYFSTVNVELTTKDPLSDPGSSVELRLYLQVVENGITYSFGQLLSVSGNKIDKIVKLNNDGTAP